MFSKILAGDCALFTPSQGVSATGEDTQGFGSESQGFSKSIFRPQGFGFQSLEGLQSPCIKVCKIVA